MKCCYGNKGKIKIKKHYSSTSPYLHYVFLRILPIHTGNFYISHIGLKMVNFGGFLGISVGLY